MDEGDRGAPSPRQAPQGQLEVALRQPVQVEFGQQPGHLLRASLEQRQDAALKALLQASNPRPSHLDGARHQRQPPRLAVAVARARGVHRRPARIPCTPERLRSPPPPGSAAAGPGSSPGPILPRSPRWAWTPRGISNIDSFTATLSFQARRHPGGLWCAAKIGRVRVAFSLFPHLSIVALWTSIACLEVLSPIRLVTPSGSKMGADSMNEPALHTDFMIQNAAGLQSVSGRAVAR